MLLSTVSVDSAQAGVARATQVQVQTQRGSSRQRIKIRRGEHGDLHVQTEAGPEREISAGERINVFHLKRHLYPRVREASARRGQADSLEPPRRDLGDGVATGAEEVEVRRSFSLQFDRGGNARLIYRAEAHGPVNDTAWGNRDLVLRPLARELGLDIPIGIQLQMFLGQRTTWKSGRYHVSFKDGERRQTATIRHRLMAGEELDLHIKLYGWRVNSHVVATAGKYRQTPGVYSHRKKSMSSCSCSLTTRSRASPRG